MFEDWHLMIALIVFVGWLWQKRIDDLNGRINDLNKRISEMDQRISAQNNDRLMRLEHFMYKGAGITASGHEKDSNHAKANEPENSEPEVPDKAKPPDPK